MKLDRGRWRTLQGYGPFAKPREDEPLFLQFSGGRTSGFMAAMEPEGATVTYQNTGREDERTLVFIERVQEAIEQEVIWLEWRPPPRLGDPPRKFGFERVDFKTASRKGEPFHEFMIAINAYRKVCGNPPISPWARGRLCTVHLKHRVLDHYVRSLGYDAHDRFVGLRADEPDRVAALKRQETRDKGLFAPLAAAGVTKADVLEFWSRQPFDLGIEEYDGNCDGCFLKDQADVSRSLGRRPPEDAAWWQAMQDTYPSFGGVNWPSYAALAHELPTRLMIERTLRDGVAPVDDGRLDPRRFKLVVIQERKRLKDGPTSFSCACESSMNSEEEEQEADEEEQERLRVEREARELATLIASAAPEEMR